ncbi:DUF5325 family protein [Alkalicoccus urumqiensis]|uniref:Uncharacterized protein n=1 Tax=Alkalicoccus urumqiensis TaxID=1548213 RepID=A0A2P6MES3_ALKUR|nr:DUF5325 family protein [Alkalicoccus urumqiensis]PRO64761.1 hypothetical protein C6I21_12690 [Alkalicoccus urumqiensis]
MRSFDIVFFLLALLGTAGMMGLGIAFAQGSLLLFILFSGMLAASLVTGFKRKKRLAQDG